MKGTSDSQDVPDAGATLVSTLKHSDLSGVVTDLGELPLDEALHPGLLRDIPILGSVVGLWRTGRSVRDYLFMKRLLSFLRPFADVPLRHREAMIEKLEKDPGFERRVGEGFLGLVERLESSDKATFAGRAFAAFCRGLLDSSTLKRLLTAIERVPLSDFSRLEAFRETGETEAVTLQEFMAAGLAILHHGMVTVHYIPNGPLCDAMLRHVLTRPSSSDNSIT